MVLERPCNIAGQELEVGNEFDFEANVTELYKESAFNLVCDFSLVLKEEAVA
jgi:hypothetical protein